MATKMNQKPIGKRRKEIRIRLNQTERDLLDLAAKRSGKRTSTWARDELLTEVRNAIKRGEIQ